MAILRICHLYPDLLNLYGDRGNIITLVQRSRWRGMEASVDHVTINEKLDLKKYDLLFIGGGQDFEQGILLPDLRAGKREMITEAIEEGLTVLAICGGFQLLGKSYKTWDGREYEFVGALNFFTLGHKERMVGDYIFRCDEISDGNSLIAGFENHSGKTYLGTGVRPLGTVLKGFGNNGQDRSEGARYRNVFCSYSHGALLPKNPGLCDLILHTALDRSHPGLIWKALDDRIEHAARDLIRRRLRCKG